MSRSRPDEPGESEEPRKESGSPGIRRWGEMAVLSGRDLLTDHAPQWAAAVAYYGLLSFFPLLLAGISIASYFVDAQWAIQQVTRVLGEFVPRGEGQIDQIIQEAIAARGSVSLLSLAALIWTGSRVFGVLTTALNIAYDVEETYSFWKRLLVEVVWTVAVGLLFILALSSGFLLNLLRDALQILPEERGTVFQVIKWIVPVLLLFGAYFLTYRFVPRGRQDWRAAVVGAGAATLLFVAARSLFVSYIQQFGQYNLIYGSIAVLIILLVWAWLVALITLFGGELASHYQMMILEGQSAAEVEERHAERSPEKKRTQAGSDRPRSASGARTRVVRPQRQG